jgi:hypothetical protein
MDLRELYHDEEESAQALLNKLQAQIWTSLPAIVESYDAKAQTVSLRIATKGIVKSPDGKMQHVEMPMLQDVPVKHISGGGITITVPLKKGDEGTVHFSSRSIDGWHQQGGVQPQVDRSMHALSHGIFHPGARSQPRALKNVSSDSIQIRSDDDDANHVIDIHPSKGMTLSSWGHKVKFAEGTLSIETEHALDFKSKTFSHNGRNISGDHRHAGVMPGSGTTDVPDAEAA